MPGLKISKESLEGPKKIKPGIYQLRFDGYEPEFSKQGNSVNLRPILVHVNNQEYFNRRQLEWLNTQAGRAIEDFLHAFGERLAGTPEDPEIPGIKNTENPDPKQWKYEGQMLGKVGRVELAENTVDGKGTYINIKRYFCAIPGCNVRHSDNLLR